MKIFLNNMFLFNIEASVIYKELNKNFPYEMPHFQAENFKTLGIQMRHVPHLTTCQVKSQGKGQLLN